MLMHEVQEMSHLPLVAKASNIVREHLDAALFTPILTSLSRARIPFDVAASKQLIS